MTPIEIIAFLFATLILVKIGYLTWAPQTWMKLTDKILKNAKRVTWIYATITFILGYFIFQSFGIIEIAAIATFISFLIGVGMLPYAKGLVTQHKKLIKNKNVWQVYWLTLTIWVLFALWTLKELFL